MEIDLKDKEKESVSEQATEQEENAAEEDDISFLLEDEEMVRQSFLKHCNSAFTA